MQLGIVLSMTLHVWLSDALPDRKKQNQTCHCKVFTTDKFATNQMLVTNNQKLRDKKDALLQKLTQKSFELQELLNSQNNQGSGAYFSQFFPAPPHLIFCNLVKQRAMFGESVHNNASVLLEFEASNPKLFSNGMVWPIYQTGMANNCWNYSNLLQSSTTILLKCFSSWLTTIATCSPPCARYSYPR